MSTQTMASHRAYQLADAITGMVLRHAESIRQERYAVEDQMRARTLEAITEAGDRQRRYRRAIDRRFAVIQRLTAALRDLPTKEER